MVVRGAWVWVAFAVDLLFVFFLIGSMIRGSLSGRGGIALLLAIAGLGVTFVSGVQGHDVCVSHYGSGCSDTTSTNGASEFPVGSCVEDNSSPLKAEDCASPDALRVVGTSAADPTVLPELCPNDATKDVQVDDYEYLCLAPD